MIGAAFAAAAPAVPLWKSGFGDGSNVGGLISAILAPTKGFGKFLVVLLALSVPSACAPTMYTFGLSFTSVDSLGIERLHRYQLHVDRSDFRQSSSICLHSHFRGYVCPGFCMTLSPRLIFIFSLIPVAIVGATRFYATLVDILSELLRLASVRTSFLPYPPSKGVIGYWSIAFAAIILCEHFVFRRCDFSMYNVEDWDKRRRLPLGAAAVLAFVGAFGVIVPSMSQAWYTGPIAHAGTGDIGVLTGFVVSGMLYLSLRTLERRWMRTKVEYS
jgi:purine-cytosine permease-like protein